MWLMREMAKLGDILAKFFKPFRVIVVYFGYFVYYCLFWLSLSRVLKETGLYTHEAVYAPAVILTVVLFLLQIVQGKALVSYGRYTKWISRVITHKKGVFHLPMFIFIFLSIAPYGVILRHAYMAAAMHAGLVPYPESQSIILPINQTVLTTMSTHLPINNTVVRNFTITGAAPVIREILSCHDLSIHNFDFFVLQSVIPLLVMSQLVFPFPNEAYTLSQNCVVALRLVESFDMMDLLSDVWCVEESGTALKVVYYCAIGIAAMLLPISISLEDLAQEISEDEKYEERKTILFLRIFKSIMTLICMDCLFFAIRITLMIKEQNIQNGYGFLIKEFFSFIFRSYYIWCALKKVRPR